MRRWAVIAGMLLLVSNAQAAEIVFFGANSTRAVLEELLPAFEQSSGDTVKASYGNIGVNADKVAKGDTADVVILSPEQIAKLLQEHKVLADAGTIIAKVGVGVFVRRGDPKPEIGTTENFRNALRAAHGIAFNNPDTGGPVGIYITQLLERLGLSAELTGQIVLTSSGMAGTADALKKGRASIGFSQMIDIAPEVELVGPLPSELQSYTIFTAAIPNSSSHQKAARALIEFLSSPAAAAVLKSKGFEPG